MNHSILVAVYGNYEKKKFTANRKPTSSAKNLTLQTFFMFFSYHFAPSSYSDPSEDWILAQIGPYPLPTKFVQLIPLLQCQFRKELPKGEDSHTPTQMD